MEILRKDACKHEYAFLIGDAEGRNFMFYCKYCLDFQLRGLKEEEQK